MECGLMYPLSQTQALGWNKGEPAREMRLRGGYAVGMRTKVHLWRVLEGAATNIYRQMFIIDAFDPSLHQEQGGGSYRHP